jgi:protein-S-isoprenylcysteine O-methyltransferase Ste14
VKVLELKIPPLALTLLVAGAMWFTAGFGPALGLAISWRAGVGGLLCLAGAGFLAFRKARTTVNPTRPHAASQMVVSGVYTLTRNPMYLGFLLGLAGWAVFLGRLLPFGFLPAFVLYMNRFQIILEERALCIRFGNQYAEYMKSVRRWL